MKNLLFLALHPSVLFFSLLAEEQANDSSIFYFEPEELSAPLSFYTENWDPQQKLLPIRTHSKSHGK